MVSPHWGSSCTGSSHTSWEEIRIVCKYMECSLIPENTQFEICMARQNEKSLRVKHFLILPFVFNHFDYINFLLALMNTALCRELIRVEQNYMKSLTKWTKMVRLNSLTEHYSNSDIKDNTCKLIKTKRDLNLKSYNR